MAVQGSSVIRRTFFRGIYEVFSNIVPGIFVIYWLSVVHKLLSEGIIEGWSDYLSIIYPSYTIPTDQQILIVAGIITLAYISGQLAYPFQWSTRKLLYCSVNRGFLHYSALKEYFNLNADFDGEEKRLYDKIIEDIRDFTGVQNIKKIEDLETEEVKSDNSQESTSTKESNISSSKLKLFKAYFPCKKFKVTSNNQFAAKEFRRTYRIVKRFVQFKYPEYYYRGYERYTGLLRFWEKLFSLSASFLLISAPALYFSAEKMAVGFFVLVTLLISLTAINRIRVYVLYPYREIFILFYLHRRGRLSNYSNLSYSE